MNRILLLGLALVLGLAILLPTWAAPAPDATGSVRIGRLIDQLGSADFTDREKASKELEAIGVAALEALLKAAKSDDPEVRRRAEELVGKMEKQAGTLRALATKKVRLVCKDTPVAEAVLMLQKQCGHAIVLQDFQGQLKDKTVTLDTGEVSFWQALDQLSAKAGLVVADGANGFIPPPPVNFKPGEGFRPGVIRPRPIEIDAPPPQPVPQQKEPGRKPLEGAKAQPVPAPQIARPATQIAQPAIEVDEVPAVPTAPPALKRPLKPIALPPGAAQPVPGQPVPLQIALPAQNGPRAFALPPPQMGGAGTILLQPGKPETLPTDYLGALRVRAMSNTAMFGEVQKDKSLIALQLLEPSLTWQSQATIRIEKALDDQEQNLTAVADNTAPPVNGPFNPQAQPFRKAVPMIARLPGFGPTSTHQYHPIHLSKGEKEAKSIKELKGVLSATVQTAAKDYLTADDIMKAAGKSFKGEEGGLLKVVSMTDGPNETWTVRIELDAPRDTVPVNQAQGVPVFPGGKVVPIPLPVPIQIQPGRRIQIQPPALPPIQPEKEAPPPQGALQIKVAPPVPAPPPPVAIPLQVQIQVNGPIQIGGGGFQGAWAIGGPMMPAHNGLVMLDEKGNPMRYIGIGSAVNIGPGGRQDTISLTYRVAKGQPIPTKLVYRAVKQVKIETAFTLKDVQLP